VAVGKSMPAGGKEFKDMSVTIAVNEEEQKSKVIKGPSSHPDFKDMLVFNVIGVDPATTPLKVGLRSKDKVVAQRDISFKEICAALKQDKWWELTVPLTSNSNSAKDIGIPKPDGQAAGGALQITFSLTGPAAALCPLCGLYLGASPIVLFGERRHHEACIACTVCGTRLQGAEFKVSATRFYCRRCFDKQDLKEDDDGHGDEALQTFPSSATIGTVAAPGAAAVPVSVSTATSLLSNDSPHDWTAGTFSSLGQSCGFCGTPLGSLLKKEEGFECAECAYPVHTHCKSLVPGNCSHDPKTQLLHATAAAKDRDKEESTRLGQFLKKSIRNVASSRAVKKNNLSAGSSGTT